MQEQLDSVEIRVLGCLIEKEMATPEYYPLSRNALANACNQKSNRYPVVAYDESTIQRAISSLVERKFVWRSDAGRVSKYNENFVKAKNLIGKEAAVICLLFLRGPQTLGELRGRTERLYAFSDLAEVESTLESLADMGLVIKLVRQPGCKECRYAHLLAGNPESEDGRISYPHHDMAPSAAQQDDDRMHSLEEEVTMLRRDLEALQKEFAVFKEQFE